MASGNINFNKHHASKVRSQTPGKNNKKGRGAKFGALCRIFRLNKISGKINPIVTVFIAVMLVVGF